MAAMLIMDNIHVREQARADVFSQVVCMPDFFAYLLRFIFICGLSCLHVVGVPCVCLMSMKPEEGTEFPGTGGLGGCEPPCGFWESSCASQGPGRYCPVNHQGLSLSSSHLWTTCLCHSIVQPNNQRARSLSWSL